MSLKALLAGTFATIALQLLVGLELMIFMGVPPVSDNATEQEQNVQLMVYLTAPNAVLLTVLLCMVASIIGTYLTIRIAKHAYVLHSLIVAVAAILVGHLMDNTPLPLWYHLVTLGALLIAALATAMFMKRLDTRTV